MSCENCGHCGGNCGGQELFLTLTELELLRRFGETPFLPVAGAYDIKTPVYLEDSAHPAEDYSTAILGLAAKGLICLDYDIPLERFDYGAYRAYPLHGSMALTGWGQEVLEQIEIQGIEE